MEFRLALPFNKGYLPIQADIVDADVPLLIGLDYLDREKLLADNISNQLICKKQGWKLPITRRNGHMFLEWDTKTILFTKFELMRLHRHFFHPSAGKLFNILKRGFEKKCTSEVKQTLEQISKECLACQQKATPHRFKVALPETDIVFNGVVALDLMWLDVNRSRKAPILHVIDTQTHFQNAVFLKGESARDVWDAFIEAWSTVYVGYPKTLKTDHGKIFTSKQWRSWTEMAGINMEISGIESHNSNGIVERYHDPLRKIFSIIRKEYPRLDPEIALRCAVKGINDTMGPEGLVPSYLVFGVIPTFPAFNTELPSQRDRMAAISSARSEMATISAKLRIQQALRSKLPPATEYIAHPNDMVFVFRERDKNWHGPFKVTKVDRKEVFVEIDGQVKHFNISQILPDRNGFHDSELNRLKESIEQFQSSNPPPGIFLTEVLEPGDSRANLPQFNVAKLKELEGLARRGVFEIVAKDDVPEDANILGSRFVLSIKNKDSDKEVYKARYVVQGHKDIEKHLLVHTSTNLRQSSVRLLLSIAALFGFRIWSQDVSQAYLQSAEKLMRDIYVVPKKEFHLSKAVLLKLLKPLYGLTDSGDYWHATLTNHLRKNLEMVPTFSDPALFFHSIKGEVQGIIGSYVDDTISTGNDDFVESSKTIEKTFESKPREYQNFKFAGMEIETREDGPFRIHQEQFAKRIETVPWNCSFSSFRSKRQELAWLVHTRPDLACAVNRAAQVTENSFSEKHISEINKVVLAARRHCHRGLIQQKLDLKTLKIVIYTDAAFSTNEDHTSQLGFLVLLSDASGKCNILHFSSSKSKRVARSVLGSEIYAFADGFDFAFCVKKDLEMILLKSIPMQMLTDSKCLFDVITKCSTCREKRLLIDIAVVKEAYQKQEISQVGHVFSDQNPADALTKIGNCPALNSILETGQLHLEVNQWVVRSPDSRCHEKESVECGNVT